MLAYAAGAWLYRSLRDQGLGARLPLRQQLWIILGMLISAWIGARLVAYVHYADWMAEHWGEPSIWTVGKTIVGGLLGGLIGVEITKRLVGVTQSTGDRFVFPLILGIAIGRIGCFIHGLHDNTYGIATALPWGVDFGDGIPRHPTQLYEIAFLAALGGVLWRIRPQLSSAGDAFRVFMVCYLAFRLGMDFLKPPHGGEAAHATLYLGLLSGIQLACLGGLAYYARDVQRIGRLAWSAR